jgi:hypothetical protein
MSFEQDLKTVINTYENASKYCREYGALKPTFDDLFTEIMYIYDVYHNKKEES